MMLLLGTAVDYIWRLAVNDWLQCFW